MEAVAFWHCGPVTAGTGQREVEVLLPLAAGLVLVALPYVVSMGVVTVIDVVTLLALGAVLPEKPWQTGAIAALPTIVGAVLQATSEPLAVFALAVLGSPLVVVLFGLVVKGGAVFLRPASTNTAGALEEDGGGGRWRPFETKVQRGRFLIVVAVLFLTGSRALSNWGAEEADRMAILRASEMRAALAGRTPESVRLEGITGAFEDRPGLPGGPYRQAILGTDTFRATAEVRHRLQHRCVHVLLTGDGQVETEIKKSQCEAS